MCLSSDYAAGPGLCCLGEGAAQRYPEVSQLSKQVRRRCRDPRVRVLVTTAVGPRLLRCTLPFLLAECHPVAHGLQKCVTRNSTPGVLLVCSVGAPQSAREPGSMPDEDFLRRPATPGLTFDLYGQSWMVHQDPTTQASGTPEPHLSRSRIYCGATWSAALSRRFLQLDRLLPLMCVECRTSPRRRCTFTTRTRGSRSGAIRGRLSCGD